MSNTPGSNAASEINPGELTLFIKDSVRGGCVFSLNHCLTWYKSFMEPHINHTPIIPSQGRCTGRSMGSRWREPDPELSPPKAASPTLPAWDGSSIPWAEPGSTMQGYAAHGWLQDSLPFLPAMFSPGEHHSSTTPPLSLVFTQHSYVEQQPAPSLCQSDLAPAGSGTLLPSRHSPPSRPPPQAPSVPRNCSLCKKKISLPVFEAPLKGNPDKDLCSLHMTGCGLRSLRLPTGAGGAVEPFLGDHRTPEPTCF